MAAQGVNSVAQSERGGHSGEKSIKARATTKAQ